MDSIVSSKLGESDREMEELKGLGVEFGSGLGYGGLEKVEGDL